MIDIYAMEEEFKYMPTLFGSDQEIKLAQIKQIIENSLTPTEKRILVLYCNFGSCRKTEQHTNIKFRQIAQTVKKALTKIRIELNKIEQSYDTIIN